MRRLTLPNAFGLCRSTTVVLVTLISVFVSSCSAIDLDIFDGPSDVQSNQFVIEQGDNSWSVTALSNGETIEDFYGFDEGNSTTTSIERSNVSELFFWEGPEGRSLVVIHDKQGSGTAGAATFRLTGLPTEQGEWVVQDDSSGAPGPDFDSKTDTVPTWRWYSNNRDGGAWRGGLGRSFEITVHPAFNEESERYPGNPDGIVEWQFLSGDATMPDRINLDMNQPVTISRHR